jgi:hypothetical protein
VNEKNLTEGNHIHNCTSSSGSGTAINYGSGSDFLTSYGSGSGSTSQKVTVPQHCSFQASHLHCLALTSALA